MTAAGWTAAVLLLTALPLAADSGGVEEPATIRRLEASVFEAVNRHRREQGLPDLAASDEVAEIARAHSRAMAAGRTGLGHDGFEARTAAIRAGMPLSAAAENVSKHGRPVAQVPGAALRIWLDSGRHRRNIEGAYQTSGVGAARDAEGTFFLTQIFVAH